MVHVRDPILLMLYSIHLLADFLKELCCLCHMTLTLGISTAASVCLPIRAHLLYACRFKGSDPRFNFPDIASLTSDSNSTLAAVLQHKGVLELSQELAETVNAQQDLAAGPQERAIRASTVVAVDKLASGVADKGLSTRQISDYLLSLAESPDQLQGQLKAHLTKGITSY